MHLKRFFVEGLAHASYLFGADGEAAVVDPKRDIEDYLEEAKRAGLKIIAIFNSHPHADFASGFRELAQRTGAQVYVSHLAPAHYDRMAAKDGEKVKLGSLEVELLETPGHSPDSLSFLVRENGRPVVVFTGDLLFVNDVGNVITTLPVSVELNVIVLHWNCADARTTGELFKAIVVAPPTTRSINVMFALTGVSQVPT